MVGVPRSKGCQTCVSRRIKCDQTVPSCLKCQKHGVECPGYDKRRKFVVEKHHIRQRAKAGPQPQESTTITARALTVRSKVSLSEAEASSTSSSAAASRSSVSPPGTTSTASPPVLVGPLPNRAQYIGHLVDQLQMSYSDDFFAGIDHWFKLDKLGSRHVLDGSMCSLTMQLLGKNYKDDTMLSHSRSLYVQSLNALQAALKHPTEWKSLETLCSAVLLCTFELFAGTTSPDTWLQHARGVGVLIKERGPAAHAEGWAAEMAIAFKGTLIMCDMFFPSNEPCFLADPEWAAVLRDGGRYIVFPPEFSKPVIDVMDDYLDRLAHIPDVLKKGYEMREAIQNGETINVVEAIQLAQKAHEAHEKFSDWHEQFMAIVPLSTPTEVLSEEEDSPYASVLSHPVSWYGAMHMGYWASMLILQEVLITCHWPADFLDGQDKLVSNILRSLESVSKGPMGPFRVGYSIRIAYEFANAELQTWIRQTLDRFTARYAATDKSMYPPPRLDNEGYGLAF